jgi:Na+-driven multidrug efflux pump
MPNSSKRRPASGISLMVDRACLFLPLVFSLLALVVQVVMHSVYWNIRSVRDSAFPLFLISALLFPFVAVVSSLRSATRGGSWVIGSVASNVLGLAILGCTLLYVFIGGFGMK